MNGYGTIHETGKLAITMATPQVSFSAFIISLATNAAIHMGDVEDPTTGKRPEPDLEAASGMIEILGLLQEKTRNNLDDEEQHILEQVLYELRMRYVEVSKTGGSRIIMP